MSARQTRTLLSMAGYDPSGGAGVLLDIAVFRHLGFLGMGVLTAVTAQNTGGVLEFRCLPARFVLNQYKALAREVSFAGIKVGMVGCRGNLRALAAVLRDNRNVPIVVDPVFRSSSGAWLLDRAAVPAYVSGIRGKITLLLPNLAEASLLTGRTVANPKDMGEAARRIAELFDSACLVKGGHLKKGVLDILFDGERLHIFKKKRIGREVHGTGCFLSSSVLGYLVKGWSLVQACEAASALTSAAIKRAVRTKNRRYAFGPVYLEDGLSQNTDAALARISSG
jgi:hydroxymethylpyrimidine kinase/phosphomethylpyrimidine kinase